MCGRFVQAMPPQEIADFFGADPSTVARAVAAPNFNVAPSQQIINVYCPTQPEATQPAEEARAADGRPCRVAERIRWGLVLPWAKSPEEGPRPINARMESVAIKPAFSRAFARHRSLVPADGFYEWKKEERGRKKPYYIKNRSGDPLAIAALWSDWRRGDREVALRTCTLITVPAARGLEEIHDRMPALLRPEDFEAWLDPENSDTQALMEILRHSSAAGLDWYPVSERVNSPAVNTPELIEPVGS